MVRARSQVLTTSLRTRYEVAHGNVHHAHERPSCELPLDRGIEYDQFQLMFQLSWIGFELNSTSSCMFAVCGACLKWASACPTR